VPDDYGEEEISVDVLIEEQRSLAHSKNPLSGWWARSASVRF
jgi:hypothetical protein